MARVAVVHNTLDFQGGADAVCLATCEALVGQHDVTLFTLSETDPHELAARFDADVDGLDVRMVPRASDIAKTLGAAAPAVGPQLAFRSSLVRRHFRRYAEAFDVAVSTANELAIPIPSVQYVHYPQFHLSRLDAADAGRLNRLWSTLAGPTDADIERATILANSAWTADVFERIYGIRPVVTHPPVDTIDSSRDWGAREDGLVVVGRLAPDKRIHRAITVTDRLRRRGHDVHLHIVGTAPRSYRQYVRAVRNAAAQRPYVQLESNVSRERLERLLKTHKYGLNLKPDEHFGMAVAEYVAAGMVAFAPDSGGQREILRERQDRLFGSLAEAVEQIATAIETDARPSLPTDRFTREQFQSAIRESVTQTLDE